MMIIAGTTSRLKVTELLRERMAIALPGSFVQLSSPT